MLMPLAEDLQVVAMRRFRCSQDRGAPPIGAFRAFIRSCQEKGFVKLHWSDEFQTREAWVQSQSTEWQSQATNFVQSFEKKDVRSTHGGKEYENCLQQRIATQHSSSTDSMVKTKNEAAVSEGNCGDSNT